MNIRPKTESELDIMRESGRILNETLWFADSITVPGAILSDIDAKIRQKITDLRGKPSFLGYRGYPASCCLSLNDVVVHGIPDNSILKEGDILGVDVGVFSNGFHADAAFTKPIGKVRTEAKRLLSVTQEALKAALDAAIAGNVVGDIGAAVQNYVNSQGHYGIIRDLAGHGVGANLQEAPEILNHKNRNTTPLINGMTLAIEPMVSTGNWQVVLDRDNWTVRTKDGSLASQYETTIIVHDNDPEVLVSFPLDYEIK